MRIGELAGYIYNDLNPMIESVIATSPDDLAITVQCDDQKLDLKRKFRIRCENVLEANLRPCDFEELEFIEKHHPLLLNYSDDYGDLSFSSVPESCDEVIARLYETHQTHCSDWRPLSEYVNHFEPRGIRALLNSGMGTIANGPYSVVSAYHESIRGLLRTSLLHFERKRAPSAKLLLFGPLHVIAHFIESSEIE